MWCMRCSAKAVLHPFIDYFWSHAAGFAPQSLNILINEPEDGTPLTISLTLLREGGTFGVVEVAWELRNGDGM